MKYTILHRKISGREKSMKNKNDQIFFYINAGLTIHKKKLYKKITYHQIGTVQGLTIQVYFNLCSEINPY